MTFEDARRYLDAGRWITRPALEDSFLSRPSVMPVNLRESVDLESDLYLIVGDGRPLVHDVETEFEIAMPYVFNTDDAGAIDWEVVQTGTD
jgi:hypothetical protein